jgi:hypothetical protein
MGKTERTERTERENRRHGMIGWFLLQKVTASAAILIEKRESCRSHGIEEYAIPVRSGENTSRNIIESAQPERREGLVRTKIISPSSLAAERI